MSTRVITSLSLLALAAAASTAGAQQPPPVRPLGPIVKVSVEPLASVASVRALPDGRVFANDIIAHRVVLFDSTLTSALVVADSTSATANAYGARPGGLIPYRGDSTLFVDPASLSMLVIDASGKIAHVISAPRPADIPYLVGGPFGTPGFDGKGRLVYRGGTLIARPTTGPDGKFVLPQMPDSAPVVRVDLATRNVDTAGFFRIPKIVMSMTQLPNGGMSASSIQNPLPQVDDWAVLPNGSIAFIRGRDYHVDWLDPDGRAIASPKMPFDWEHLNDDQKAAFLDSAKAVITARTDSLRTQMEKSAVNGVPMVLNPGGGRGADASGMGGGGGGGMMIVRMQVDDGGAGAGKGNGGGPPPSGQPALTMPPPQFVQPNELPDYKPPFQQGATRADADGNLWIRTTKVTEGRAVYDIVNSKGVLIDRVQLPAFRTIAGFGPGVVYMGVKDAEGIVHLERARIK
jgi:hypothetical protein